MRSSGDNLDSVQPEGETNVESWLRWTWKDTAILAIGVSIGSIATAIYLHGFWSILKSRQFTDFVLKTKVTDWLIVLIAFGAACIASKALRWNRYQAQQPELKERVNKIDEYLGQTYTFKKQLKSATIPRIYSYNPDEPAPTASKTSFLNQIARSIEVIEPVTRRAELADCVPGLKEMPEASGDCYHADPEAVKDLSMQELHSIALINIATIETTLKNKRKRYQRELDKFDPS